jgi:predicted RND superfamily exporter protein
MDHDRPSRRRYVLPALVAALILLSVGMVIWRVDLSPKVESDFFFSTDDPQLQASERIGELFPSRPQILITAAGEDVLAEDYLERLRALGDELKALDGIHSVQSLTHGPPSLQAVPGSPLWSRLLLGDSPNTSLLIATVEDGAGGGLVSQVEEIVDRRHSPAFALRVSGVPYVVELIRRHLERDLRVFSTAALLIFGLLIAVIYRSLRIVAGTLISCLGACAVTLTGLHLAGKSIGLLTANIVTIVFVLTLSHIVFLTANWRRETDPDAVARAVRVTFGASFWCMATTFLGFSSLLFVSAKPLRELGFAGAFGTAVAIAVAYGLYPAFLQPRGGGGEGRTGTARFPLRSGAGVVAGAAVVTVAAAFGLPRLDTDPDMLSYFEDGSDIRTGIELVDRNGGSSPLLIVVGAGEGQGEERLDVRPAVARLGKIQQAFDDDPAVGVSLSLPLLIAEARRVPVAFLLSDEQIVDLLDSDNFDHIARSFITPERTEALFFLRMHEGERREPRRAVLERLLGHVAAAGFEPRLVGGLYELQAQLGELVRRSLLAGLAGLLVLFLVIAVVVGRSPRTVLAMGSLVSVPILVLGLLGHLGRPLDVISSPAVNVAIALGIDSMIHLVLAVRRHRRAGDGETDAWRAARDELWQPIAGAMLILAAGFGIFGLSSFPPTQRFGLAVAGGTAAAAFMALFVLPWLATRGRPSGERPAE